MLSLKVGPFKNFYDNHTYLYTESHLYLSKLHSLILYGNGSSSNPFFLFGMHILRGRAPSTAGSTMNQNAHTWTQQIHSVGVWAHGSVRYKRITAQWGKILHRQVITYINKTVMWAYWKPFVINKIIHRYIPIIGSFKYRYHIRYQAVNNQRHISKITICI